MDKLHENDSFLPVELKFYPEEITAVLNVDKKYIDLEIKKDIASKRNLSEKDEFHLTIIGSNTWKEIIKILESLDENEKNERIKMINDFLESYNWRVVLEPVFYYIKKEYNNLGSIDHEIRQSIIQIAQIYDLEKFYQQLSIFLNKNFKIPLSHVTLYTTSTRVDKILRGIWIYSKEQFNDLSPEVI